MTSPTDLTRSSAARGLEPRMQGIELLAAREALGLTREVLAASAGYAVSTVRVLERGQAKVPEKLRRHMELLEAYTEQVAAATALELAEADPEQRVVLAWVQTHEMPDLGLADAPLQPSARWWRVVAYRAQQKVRGSQIREGEPV